MLAIGIDMSKATFHAALDDVLVRKFRNTSEGIDDFIRAIAALGHIPEETTLGIESTGVYHLLFCTKLVQTGYHVQLINPLESHRFISARTLRQRKTDAIDAQAIRAMVFAGVGRPFIETDEVLCLRALVAERTRLYALRQHRGHEPAS
jgi:transposase